MSPRTRLTPLLAVAVITLVAGSAWAGFLVVDRALDGSVVEPSTPSPAPTLPAADVEGEDLDDLPRYPGAVRTAFARQRQGSTAVATVEYLATAELDDVRAFYRRVFREREWNLIELDFARGEWVFLVESGNRAALVEIEEHALGTVIQIEVERPLPATVATPEPTRPQPTAPPPPTDDDPGGD